MIDLSRIPLFRGLDPGELTRLQRAGQELAATHGQCLFRRGDAAEAAFVILAGEGQVEVGAADVGAKQLMVEVFRAGDLVGEMGALDGAPRSADALVEGQLRLLRLPAAVFRAALRDVPGLGFNLSLLLAGRLRRTFTLLQDAAFERLETRLARQILYLAGRGATRGPAGLRLSRRLNQQQMADLLGTTTRSIITILNAWREQGLVAYDTTTAHLTLRNEAALRALLAARDSG